MTLINHPGDNSLRYYFVTARRYRPRETFLSFFAISLFPIPFHASPLFIAILLLPLLLSSSPAHTLSFHRPFSASFSLVFLSLDRSIDLRSTPPRRPTIVISEFHPIPFPSPHPPLLLFLSSPCQCVSLYFLPILPCVYPTVCPIYLPTYPPTYPPTYLPW